MLPRPPANIAALLARPVAALGAGVSGTGVLSLLAAVGVTGQVYDEQAAGAEKTFGARQVATHAFVVFSPGFAPDHAWLAARAAGWWRHAGLPEVSHYAAARTFQLGAHRLTRVEEKCGVTFWNDSKATSLHAVEAALATFAAPVLWIWGGRAKEGDLAGFVRRIAQKIRQAFHIGETSPALAGFCRETRVPATPCGSLEEAVRSAFARATAGDHVLPGPGLASFGMFRGYDDRGRSFVNLVENL